jgi:NAD(P)-dependent dehydrogenase (short-subunit alcohol dehydrogenase family)
VYGATQPVGPSPGWKPPPSLVAATTHSLPGDEERNMILRKTELPDVRATGKVIIITGATRGLGRALALKFAALGHTVIGCGRSRQHIERLRKELAAPHDFSVVDVASDRAVEAWAKRILEERGAPDLLVNNAAVMNRPAPLWKQSAEEFDRIIDVNIKGVVHVIRHFLPAMIAQGAGLVVNFSSGWGRSTSPDVAPYCASKWAIEGLTRALAQELPQGLAAVSLNPGVIDTDMLRSTWGDSAGDYQSPAEWAERAAPFILKLGPQDNGKPLAISRQKE